MGHLIQWPVMKNRPTLRLHIPEPAARPGDAPSFDRALIPSAGATRRPETNALEAEMRDLPFGLVRVLGAEAQARFSDSMDGLVHIKENRDRFWLEIFNHLVSRGTPVHTVEIDGATEWQEIDFR